MRPGSTSTPASARSGPCCMSRGHQRVNGSWRPVTICPGRYARVDCRKRVNGLQCASRENSPSRCVSCWGTVPRSCPPPPCGPPCGCASSVTTPGRGWVSWKSPLPAIWPCVWTSMVAPGTPGW
ncbi:hypothetical protein M911_04955 [Ectothiorhodospira haloalkaliphila]|uniref:Uncharacterized protein n=1 Tax=Ectothiorhodospira haloalkaliphila TaxID=421628 RepID=W8KNS0_9GAMM|nr:hypothetical protein M911_04955 [Ectothiorhodospira haloalkaliphila]